jgi:branched-subunit amino acid ABC-type transport system permease component
MDFLYKQFSSTRSCRWSKRRTFCCRCCGKASSPALYALIALGFVLIFKASGVFNFAQGIMVVFAATDAGRPVMSGVPAYLALILTIGVMGLLAVAVERFVMRPLVNQPDIILFMATIGLTYFLIGFRRIHLRRRAEADDCRRAGAADRIDGIRDRRLAVC